jgi:hypothetical protein
MADDDTSRRETAARQPPDEPAARRTLRARQPAAYDGACRGVNDLGWIEEASLFASGTDALVALVRWGASRHGWRRVWLPSYYCPEVPAGLAALERDGIELLAYSDHLLTEPPAIEAILAEPGDVIVVANQLGIRRRPDPGRAVVPGAVVVEDHSHDPGSAWARASGADYAFASLRKTLPIPDGGAAWTRGPPGTARGRRPRRAAARPPRRGARPARGAFGVRRRQRGVPRPRAQCRARGRRIVACRDRARVPGAPAPHAG